MAVHNINVNDIASQELHGEGSFIGFYEMECTQHIVKIKNLLDAVANGDDNIRCSRESTEKPSEPPAQGNDNIRCSRQSTEKPSEPPAQGNDNIRCSRQSTEKPSEPPAQGNDNIRCSRQSTEKPSEPPAQGKVISNKRSAKKHQSVKKFSCHLCSYNALKKVNLTQHMFTHTKPFSCDLCPYTGRSKQYLQKHLFRAHNNGIAMNCSLCSYSTLQAAELREHLKTDHDRLLCSFCHYTGTGSSDEIVPCSRHKTRDLSTPANQGIMTTNEQSTKEFICYHCNYKAPMKYYMTQHMYTHTKPFKCEFCMYSGRSQQFLERHVFKNHNNGIPIKCSLCSYTTLQTVEFREHTKSNHNPYKCNLCEYRAGSKHQIQSHSDWRHNKGDGFSCTLCSFFTYFSEIFRKHVRQNHMIKFSCKNCDYKCLKKSDLRNHVSNMHKERELACKCCSFVTKRNPKFKSHIYYKHLNEKEMNCPKCDFSPSEAESVQEHLLNTHLKGLVLSCAECAYKTVDKALLRRHVKVHLLSKTKKRNLKRSKHNSKCSTSLNNSELHPCLYCDFKTRHKTSLKRHVNKLHSNHV